MSPSGSKADKWQVSWLQVQKRVHCSDFAFSTYGDIETGNIGRFTLWDISPRQATDTMVGLRRPDLTKNKPRRMLLDSGDGSVQIEEPSLSRLTNHPAKGFGERRREEGDRQHFQKVRKRRKESFTLSPFGANPSVFLTSGESSFGDLYVEGHLVGPAGVLDDELVLPVLLRRDLN